MIIKRGNHDTPNHAACFLINQTLFSVMFDQCPPVGIGLTKEIIPNAIDLATAQLVLHHAWFRDRVVVITILLSGTLGCPHIP